VSDLAAELRAGLSDRYVIDRELGRGGMATVYLARDVRHDRMVALKVVHSTLESPSLESRFQHEIRVAARLTHPHILTVFDSGETAGHLWFTMPYVEGESLRDRLLGIGRLPIERAVRVTREAAQALSYAHRHNVIHRDVKPENILLTDEGSTLVADFGIARAIQTITSTGGTVRSPITEVGAVIGTPAYMSPEQRVGVSVDIRTDIYSLAIVLAEMLTGETPAGTRGMNALQALKADSTVQVRKQRPEVPAGLEKVIANALSVDPGKRYPSMDAFSDALEEFDGASRKRTPPPPRYVALAAGLAVIAVIAAWGMTRRGGPSAPSADHPLRIAVLPFINQGDTSNAYFADGVTDAVRGKLTSLAGLEVISSTSSNLYASSTKNATQIGQELGVDYLVVGKVRWSKGGTDGSSRVQVSPELITVKSGASKWQQSFDAALTDVFKVQSDIAGQVANALDVALDAGERAQLAEKPTENLQAYDLYLKARAKGQAQGRTDPASMRAAIPLYQQAIALDPRFSDAWAGLSTAHTYLYANTAPLAENLVAAKREADSAIALAPRRPTGYLTLSTYYSIAENDPERALQAATTARQMGPADARLVGSMSSAEYNLGRFDEALAHAREAVRLDPRSPNAVGRLVRTLGRMRHYAEAEALAPLAITLAPDDPQGVQQAMMFRLHQGDLAGAKGRLNAEYPAIQRGFLLNYVCSYNDMFWILSPAQQDTVLQQSLADFDGDLGTYGLVKAEILSSRGDTKRTAALADSARRGFEEQIQAAPGQGQLYGLLGMSLQLMGHNQEAMVQAEKGKALSPLDRNLNNSSYTWMLASRIYARANQPDKAIDILEKLLTLPGDLSRDWLRLDPYFAPLRGQPRFQQLVAGH
jgi:serine/threonine-protein kinase